MRHVFLVLAGVAVLGASMGRAEVQQTAPDPQKVEAGKKLYASEGCAKCHQVAGQGNRMSVLDGVADKLTAEELKMWLTSPDEMAAKLPRRPVVRMPKSELEETELDQLVAYLQTLKKS